MAENMFLGIKVIEEDVEADVAADKGRDDKLSLGSRVPVAETRYFEPPRFRLPRNSIGKQKPPVKAWHIILLLV